MDEYMLSYRKQRVAEAIAYEESVIKHKRNGHQLKWDHSRNVWACINCPATFGIELTYPANSTEEAKRIIASLGDFIEDDPASIGS